MFLVCYWWINGNYSLHKPTQTIQILYQINRPICNILRKIEVTILYISALSYPRIRQSFSMQIYQAEVECTKHRITGVWLIHGVLFRHWFIWVRLNTNVLLIVDNVSVSCDEMGNFKQTVLIICITFNEIKICSLNCNV